MASIQFSHISKVFLSGTEAVKNFNLEVTDGEFLVIVGSSGCGKSTILRMVAGLEEITTGELRIDGEVVNDLDPKKRNVAMVFQNYALFPNLTVQENMEFALKMQRVPKKERRDKVAVMAKMLGIEDLLKRKAKGLSGGQCQRIAIGRALVCQPRVFLLDEPLSNLDNAMRTELRGEIAQLQRSLGITTLYVTHDQIEAMTLGSRVLVMDHGEIQQVDTPQNIYLKPQNTFVARFVGYSPMNLFNAKCVLYRGEAALQIGEMILPLPNWKSTVLADRGYIGKQVIVGIRTESVFPDCEEAILPNVKTEELTATVIAIDVLGAEKKLHLTMEGAELSAMVRTYTPVEVGDSIQIKIAVDQIHIFDFDTTLAITH